MMTTWIVILTILAHAMGLAGQILINLRTEDRAA